jgi:hypothetical protein
VDGIFENILEIGFGIGVLLIIIGLVGFDENIKH